MKLKNDLTDSSRFDSDGNGSSCSHASNAKAKTIICFRGSINPKDIRKDHTLGNIPPVYTCSYCGRKGHLRRFCFDLGKSSRKFMSSVPLVPETPMRCFTSIWVRKSLLDTLDFRQVDSRLLAHDSSLAISYRWLCLHVCHTLVMLFDIFLLALWHVLFVYIFFLKNFEKYKKILFWQNFWKIHKDFLYFVCTVYGWTLRMTESQHHSIFFMWLFGSVSMIEKRDKYLGKFYL